MKKYFADLIKRFTSRKFLLTVGGIIGVVASPEHSGDIITLITVYNGAEGAADIVGRYAGVKTGAAKTQLQPMFTADDAELDMDSIAPGVPDRQM